MSERSETGTGLSISSSESTAYAFFGCEVLVVRESVSQAVMWISPTTYFDTGVGMRRSSFNFLVLLLDFVLPGFIAFVFLSSFTSLYLD